MIKSIGASVIGPSHVELGIENQDAIGGFIHRDYWLAAVSDGMGSCIYAQLGSKQAIRSVKAVLTTLDFTLDDKQVITQVYQHWLKAIKAYGIKPQQAVATLLFVWGNRQGLFRYFQLGDGIICSADKVYTPTQNNNFSNQTTGLGLSRHLSDWHVGEGASSSILLMTDGISDDVSNYCGFAKSIFTQTKGKSPRLAKKSIKKLLTDWPTPKHSDDKSLMMVVNK